MKTLLASLLALVAVSTSSVALAETKESSALDRAVRTHHVARPVDAPKAVPVGCSARLLLTSTTQTVITCDK
jgi:hypothetical protein